MTDETLAQAALFQLTGVGVVQTDMTTGRFVRANGAFCEMVGYSEAELRGVTYLELTHPDDRERDAASFAASQQGEGSGVTSLTRALHKDGSVVWLELHVTVLGEADEAVNFTVVNDVTERRQADEALCESESRQAFLLALSDELRPLTSPGDIAEAAARRLTERLDVTRVAYGDIEDRTLSIEREDSRGVPSIIGEYDMQPFGDDFLAAYRSGAVITSADVAADDRFSDLVKADLATRGISAFVDVVLFEEDRAVSLFIVQHVAPRAWSEAELNLIREVAERVRTAIERARVERALRESEEQQAFLLKLSDALRPLADVAEIQGEATRLLGEQSGASWCYYIEFDETDTVATILRDATKEGLSSLVGVHDLSDVPEFTDLLRAGSVFNAPDISAFPLFNRRIVELYTAIGMKSALGTPLVKNGRLIALLVLADTRPRQWTDDAITLLKDVAERLWATIERAHAEAALHELNHTLEQRVEARTEALRHSEQRFSQAFYANPIPACMTTFGRETFVEVNDAFLALTGYEHDEVVGKGSRELAMWSSLEDQKKRSEAQRDGRGFHNLELGMLTKAGEAKNILISAAVIQLNGEPGYLKMFYDVTEQRRTQEQMHRAISEVMSDTGWFSHKVMERLAHIKTGSAEVLVPIDLSKRERQVLERLAGGLSNEAIAKDLGLSAQTIRNYISAIYSKLDVHSRAEAIIWARERGIVGG